MSRISRARSAWGAASPASSRAQVILAGDVLSERRGRADSDTPSAARGSLRRGARCGADAGRAAPGHADAAGATAAPAMARTPSASASSGARARGRSAGDRLLVGELRARRARWRARSAAGAVTSTVTAPAERRNGFSRRAARRARASAIIGQRGAIAARIANRALLLEVGGRRRERDRRLVLAARRGAQPRGRGAGHGRQRGASSASASCPRVVKPARSRAAWSGGGSSSAEMGRPARKDSSYPGRTTSSPRGRAQAEAMLAASREDATPSEASSPRRRWSSSRTLSAARTGAGADGARA